MDYFAHGLWSYILFSKTKKPLWAVFFGLLPDNLSWAIYFFYNLFTRNSFGKPMLDDIPDWVWTLYGISHSLVVFAAVLLIVYLIFKTVPIYIYAWPIEIVIDLFTHTKEFLPTPFLWPISSYHFDGISWGSKWFMIVNYILIVGCLGWIYFSKRKSKS